MTAMDARVHDSLQAASPAPVVEILSAEKIFPGGVRGLDPVSLTIQPGSSSV